MRAFIRYFTDYYRSTSRPALFVTIAFIASLVYANYSMGIERRIQALPWYAAYGPGFICELYQHTPVWGTFVVLVL